MPGRNPVIDNLTKIHLLKLRIEELESYIDKLHTAFQTAGNALGMSEKSLESLRQSRELVIGEDAKRLWESKL